MHFSHAGRYSRQLWLMFWGNLITATGQGLVWPFLTINMRRQMDVPLTQITVLFTLQSMATMLATTALGPMMDRFGRKWPMVIGYLISSASIFSMSRADTLPAWGVLLALYAIAGASFQMGSNAMIADMIAPDRRAGAYALLRTASNLGIAIGPPIGGLLTGVSYELTYYLAAGIQFVMVFFVFTMLRETLDRKARTEGPEGRTERAVGYGPLLHDWPFLTFWGVYLLVEVAAALVFTLLGVYVKEQFGIPESQYSLIMMTNAVMVVLLQYGVTRLTRRYAPPARHGVERAVLCAGAIGVRAGPELLGVLARHGHHDHRRADDQPDGNGNGGEPRPAGYARPLYGRLRPVVPRRIGCGTGHRRLFERQHCAVGDLVRRRGLRPPIRGRLPVAVAVADVSPDKKGRDYNLRRCMSGSGGKPTVAATSAAQRSGFGDGLFGEALFTQFTLIGFPAGAPAGMPLPQARQEPLRVGFGFGAHRAGRALRLDHDVGSHCNFPPIFLCC